MHHPRKPAGPRARWRTAAVVPAVVVTWLALGMAGGVAQAAQPSGHDAAVVAGNGSDNGNGSGNGNGGTGNGNGNGNAKHQDPVAPTTPPAPEAGGSSDHSGGTAGTSGDPTQPQPPSNADQNKGGANNGGDCGSYCSTRDGSPSGNGNGKGKATGKPCAGCVGKADNKNPPGQYKDGSDHNAGYECDRNHGIGRSNPAHTGCTTSEPTCEDLGNCPPPTCEDLGNCPPPTCEDQGNCPPPTCEEQGNCPPTTCEDDGTCPTGCVPTEANNFCTDVEGNHHTRKPVVEGEKVVKTPKVLPFTGAANVGLLLGSGALALALGTGLVLLAGRRSRRQGA